MEVLSIPTWIIHVSSVIEWIAAIWLVWIYSELTQRAYWKIFAWAMLPVLVGAMCACTWHFFNNDVTLSWLVDLQASMTFLGNTTLCIAAWWIWRSTHQTKSSTLLGDTKKE